MPDIHFTLSQLRLLDVIDILVIAFIIYHVLVLIKGTRGWQITLGVSALFLFYYLTSSLDLRTVEWLFANFFTYFILALIVIFQQEIRRGLAAIGRGRFVRRLFSHKEKAGFEQIVLAATTFSERRIGALIVIECGIGLKNYIETGIQLDSLLSYDLLVTIFNPKSPLHDGAVVVQDDRIAAAACFLPLTTSPYLSKETGSRHRAGIGISEESDAIVVIVSEESGRISAVSRGQMTHNLDGPRLLAFLQKTAHVSEAPDTVVSSERQQEAG